MGDTNAHPEKTGTIKKAIDRSGAVSNNNQKFSAKLKKRWNSLPSNQRTCFIIIGVFCCLVIMGLAVSKINSSFTTIKLGDLAGLTIEKATKILDEKGILYEIGDEIYDENAKSEQTVSSISKIWDANGFEDISWHFRKNVWQTYVISRGQKIHIVTEDLTKAQQAAIDQCTTKGDDYEYDIEDGDVSCEMTYTAKHRLAKESCEAEGKYLWSISECITQEEAATRKARAEKAEAERKEAEKKQAEEEAAKKQAEEEAIKKQAEEEQKRQADEQAAKEAAEKSTFPDGEMSTAMDVCTDQFYYSKGISIVPALKNWKNSFWSGNDFIQTVNIADGKIRIVCQYNWKDKTATITDWNYL